MLVLTLLRDGDEFIRVTTASGEVIEIKLIDVRDNEKARLGIDAPRAFPIERVNILTGKVAGRPRTPEYRNHRSLSDGVAEATLACTGADSSAPLPRTDAGEAPLVQRGQGEYIRATSGRDVARDSALGGLINAIA